MVENNARTAEAVRFLRALAPAGRIQLAAIPPEGGPPEARNFDAGDAEGMGAWIEARRDRANVHYALNEPAPTAPDRKLRKADVGVLRGAGVDLDPQPGQPLEAERERLLGIAEANRAGELAASFAVDSGGGVQLVWTFFEPLPATDANREAAEALGRDLAAYFGGDPVQNVDHLLRLPGTVNHPDARKRAAGRIKAHTKALHVDGPRWGFEALRAKVPEAPHDRQEADDRSCAGVVFDWDDIAAVASYTEIPPAVREVFEQALASDGRLRALWQGEKAEGDRSRSGFDFALGAQLKRHGFGATAVGQLLQVYEHGRGADGELTPRYLQRAYGRAPHRTALEDFAGEIAPNLFDDAANWSREQIESNSAALAFLRHNAPGRYEELRALWDMLDTCHREDLDRQQERVRERAEAERPARGRLFYERFDEIEPNLEQSTLVGGLLDPQAMSVVYGESNSGKTYFVLNLALHVALGWQWHGRAVTQAAVVYVAAEGGGSLKRRAAAFRQAHALGTEAVPFALVPCPVNLLDPKGDTKPLVELITEVERDFGQKVGLVVVDTLSRALAGGNENAPDDMGAFVRNVDAIRTDADTHTLVVHHTGKDRAKGARGHSSLRAATDTEIEVAPGLAKATKQRDRESGQVFGFTLEPVPIGTTAEDEIITACIVRQGPVSAAEDFDPAELSPRTRQALDILRELARGEGEAPHEQAPAEIHVSVDRWREACRDRISEGGRRAQNQAFDRAKRTLLEKGIIRLKDSGRVLLLWG